jgi:predicted nucleic acid-binding protein
VIRPYLDASALAKRYLSEVGSPEIDHLFARVPTDQMVVLTVGLAEVVSILVRQRNSGRLTAQAYTHTMRDFIAEVGASPLPTKVAVDEALASAAFALIERHSLNSTDAILLHSALTLAQQLRRAGDDLVLVASDQRLLRAAQAEGLVTFNPETQAPADLDALLGP